MKLKLRHVNNNSYNNGFLFVILFLWVIVLLYFMEEYTTAMAIDFQRLQSRLITNLRERVRSGEITERSLARITGISQPHLHNVLKGKRLLSVGKADQMLRQLHLDLTDLMDKD
jgi:hypothetical protein